MKTVEFNDGLAILGDCTDRAVLDVVTAKAGPLVLSICDPPYGRIVDEHWDKIGEDDYTFSKWMIGWTLDIARMSCDGAALYVFGGTGKPRFRPFYRYLVDAERATPFVLADHITWKKRRAYGQATSYLYVREELAYFVKAENPKKPRTFHVPLLAKKRPYAGYNAKYPAKSEFYRRGNVWTDVGELLRGKIHPTQKPDRLLEIPIEVHTDPGEYVFDPFAGSGTTGRAARNLNRRFILIEKDETEFEKMIATLR